ncbi:2Fe-2S iron-sulfur cluster binding domain-containing protein [Actinacidiphila rubida]|uniref:2Fe-2S iron-sulfur cluster binding domain-containing protein n=1 Tax=Actinacidiphila rubida TaxID=310780 RepID=A0A1H8T8N9_9ACTN|nr:(2Fe-2S)-binding protein [Actinacidiphila rubida]SEO87106.1 2Fe-2S iron-sulfur cluster binding domain-containing protein [Actinacidiphila rubida]
MTHRTEQDPTGPAQPPPAAYRMTFRGTTVTADPGQSVAAALVAVGILDWRTTRKEGRPRGLFCGIGVCFDCLISVDGAPAERACVVPAADGMRLGEDPRLERPRAAGPRPEDAGTAPSEDAGAGPEGAEDAGSEPAAPGPGDAGTTHHRTQKGEDGDGADA